MNLSKMKRFFPEDYNFAPRTWLLPNQYEEFKRYADLSKNRNKYYICKPEGSCQGRGIFLTKRYSPDDKASNVIL